MSCTLPVVCAADVLKMWYCILYTSCPRWQYRGSRRGKGRTELSEEGLYSILYNCGQELGLRKQRLIDYPISTSTSTDTGTENANICIGIESVLHQDEGGIGKSIPSALQISLDPRDFPWASPSGNLSGLGKSFGRQGWISQYLPRLSGARIQSLQCCSF